jgi:hypothetical protein
MNRITAARTHVEHAENLPALLAAALAAFEDLLQVIRCHEERDDNAFAAFILSAGAAANGRDRIAAAPSLPPAAVVAFAARQTPATSGLLADATVTQVALAVAGLSDLLARRLAALAVTAADPGDQVSCTHAARHAARIRSLLGGAREP